MIGTNIGQMCRFVLQTPVTIFAWVKSDQRFALKMLRSSKVINVGIVLYGFLCQLYFSAILYR